ncbi:type VI secretion system Vgr family protein [Spirosoma luteum]|uniref:type VI secretion system Vgr family protein n=1 Tax=Spirosoma luteum TaxID=431553 RepID=UPI00037A115C|nr:type VI secretion system Vgr family protein [Spirosoma luteum]
MARQINVQIELEGGKELKYYTYLRINQHLNTHHTFEVGVPFSLLEDASEHFFHQAHQDVCGKAITLSFSPATDKDSFDFTFKGIVTDITLMNTSDLSNGFVLKGYSPTIVLEDSRVRRTFLQQSLQRIAEAVLDPYPGNLLRRKLKPRTTVDLPYTVQYDETNFEFLNRLTAEQGEWFYYDGRELRMGPPDSGKSVDFLVDGIQLFSLSIGLQPTQQTLTAHDYQEPAQYSSQSSGQSVSGLGQFGSFALQKSEEVFGQASQRVAGWPLYGQSELDEVVKTQKAVSATGLLKFSGSGEVPNLLVGGVIDVQGMVVKRDKHSKESFGKYRITNIQHEVDSSGNYQNQFRAVPESVAYPPPNPHYRPPVAQPELAQVSDNDDPDKLGRVKVTFLWAGPDKESDWLRVSSAYTGAGDGLLFVPELDAYVMIGYEGGRPENPFVIGSLYPKNSGSDYTYSDNNKKIIQTKGGNQLLFLEDSGSEQIQISNVNHTSTVLTLEFAGNGTITLKTPGEIKLEGDSIHLKAQSDITLEAGQNLTMKARNKATLNGGTGVEMGAPEVKINADATAELQANASLKLKGAMVSLNGDAMVEVQAALIKLN